MPTLDRGQAEGFGITGSDRSGRTRSCARYPGRDLFARCGVQPVRETSNVFLGVSVRPLGSDTLTDAATYIRR